MIIIYNVFTAFNGLQSINSSINDTKDILNKSSNDKSSQEYQDAKNKLDSLIVERNAQSLSLASSMTALIKTHNSDSNFANFGLNATQSISNGAIFVERLTRSNVGSDGRQVDISLAIDILSTSLKAIISGVQAMDDIVADATKGIAKKIPKPWVAIAKILEGVPDTLGLIANNLVDLDGNSKIVYYLDLEDTNPDHKDLIINNGQVISDLMQEFYKIDFLNVVAEQISINTEIFIREFIKDWKDALIGTNNDKGMIYYGKETKDIIFGTDDIDYLVGHEGNDIIQGLENNDYLNGGQGYDTYHIKDHDTIYDADGRGKILFNDKQLPKNFIKQEGASGVWEAKDGAGKVIYTAIRSVNDLAIFSTNSPDDSVTIKDFFTTATKRGTTYSTHLWA